MFDHMTNLVKDSRDIPKQVSRLAYGTGGRFTKGQIAYLLPFRKIWTIKLLMNKGHKASKQ